MSARLLFRISLGDHGECQHFGGCDDPARGEHGDQTGENFGYRARGVRFHGAHAKRLRSLKTDQSYPLSSGGFSSCHRCLSSRTLRVAWPREAFSRGLFPFRASMT